MSNEIDESRPLRDLGAYVPVLLPAAALGVAALAFARHKRVAAALFAVGGALGLAKSQLDRFFNEQPRFQRERRARGIEIRRYSPRIVAETEVVASDLERALNEGFRRLAGYIFGGNRQDERIAMTSPVNARSEGGTYTVQFTMPKKHTLATLPPPVDSRVHVRKTGEERFAVLRYRGTYRADTTRDKQKELLARVRAAGLEPTGAPIFAGYDSPAVLPFLRRVEAWVPIA